MTNMFPMMQGDHPGRVPYGVAEDKAVQVEPWMVWCSPTVSYHHVSVDAVDKLWHFEQTWIRDLVPVGCYPPIVNALI